MRLRGHMEPAKECEHGADGADCLAALAEQRSTTGQLCAACTRRLMLAIDWVTNRDNRWSAEFVRRAESGPDTTASLEPTAVTM